MPPPRLVPQKPLNLAEAQGHREGEVRRVPLGSHAALSPPQARPAGCPSVPALLRVKLCTSAVFMEWSLHLLGRSPSLGFLEGDPGVAVVNILHRAHFLLCFDDLEHYFNPWAFSLCFLSNFCLFIQPLHFLRADDIPYLLL